VETKGHFGVALAFKPAIKVKRSFFMTPAFVNGNRALCTDLAEVLQLQECNFQLLNRQGLDDAIAKLTVSRARQLIVLRNDQIDEDFPKCGCSSPA